MSGSGDGGGGGIGRREVAVRCFAAEYDDASLEYSESDEERAPNYVVTPTGARVNRLFVVGVLTEVESVSDDVLRGRVVDPTGAFVVYAGQYQPDAKTFLERAEPPQFVAVTGKARTFEPDDADTVYTSVRPESINAVDSDTRDRWSVQTAEFTIERVAAFAAALERDERGQALQETLRASGVDPALAAGIPRAIDHYGTTGAYLAAVREMALQAAEVVAGERDEVDPLGLAPDEGGSADVDLSEGIEIEATAETSTAAAVEAPVGSAEGDESSPGAAETTPDEGTAASEGDVGTEADAGSEADAGAEAVAETEANARATDASGGAEASEAPEPEEATAAAEGASAGAEGATAGAEGRTAEPEGATADGEPSGESASTGEGDDELGDFDDFGADAETEGAAGETAAGDAESSGAVTDEMYEMDDEEREAIEEEFGTEFSTGSEVDEPGEAGIETPGPVEGGEEGAEPERAAPAEESTDDETEDVSTAAPAVPEDEAAAPGDEAGVEMAKAEGQTDEGDADAADEESDEAVEEVDLQDAVVDAMGDLDEGDGADREAVIDEVVSELGVDRGAVEDAIQDALMGGRCYEPDDGRLKAI